jgi:hypothetical protein
MALDQIVTATLGKNKSTIKSPDLVAFFQMSGKT